MIKIDYNKCCWKNGKCVSCNCGGECKGCVEVCPQNALNRKDILIIDLNKCTGCGICTISCKHGALKLE